VCNTESIFLCVSTSEAEPPPLLHITTLTTAHGSFFYTPRRISRCTERKKIYDVFIFTFYLFLNSKKHDIFKAKHATVDCTAQWRILELVVGGNPSSLSPLLYFSALPSLYLPAAKLEGLGERCKLLLWLQTPVAKYLCILLKIASGCNNLPNVVLVTGSVFHEQKLPYAGGGKCIPSGSTTGAV